MPRARINRFPGPNIVFSRILRVEEVDLDRDGVFEALVEGIGTVQSIPNGIPTFGFVSKQRLPFESPLLAVLRRQGARWKALFMAHVPLRCGQTDDPSTCDQVMAFRSVRFRFDDRPQVVYQMLHPGEQGSNETRVYRGERGVLQETFSVSLPRASVDVDVRPASIERRVAVDTFVNRELPARYRSFTLQSSFVFGERSFRVLTESVREEWSERGDTELAYWGLSHQPIFQADIERLRERQRRAAADAPWALDPVEVVKKRLPDAERVRIGVKQPGVVIVAFERPGCFGRAVLYQPLRETEGDRSLWEMGIIRSRQDTPYECLAEAPLEIER